MSIKVVWHGAYARQIITKAEWALRQLFLRNPHGNILLEIIEILRLENGIIWNKWLKGAQWVTARDFLYFFSAQ